MVCVRAVCIAVWTEADNTLTAALARISNVVQEDEAEIT
jgi:hypothetical protein